EEHHARRGRGRGDVLDQVEEGVLGPVDVVEDDDEWLSCGRQLEEPPRSPEHLVQWVSAFGEADCRRNAYGRIGTLRSCELEKARTGLLGRVLAVDAGGVARDLEKGPERDAASISQAPATYDPAFRRDPAPELVDEARLAGARLRDERDETAHALGSRGRERGLERLELAGAPDDRTAVIPLQGLGCVDRDEPICGDTLRLSLGIDGIDRFDLHRVPHEPVGRLAEQDFVRRRRLLQTRCGVHDVSGHEPLARCRVARHDLARVDAGPVPDRDAPALLELGVQLRQCVAHLGCGPHGAEGVVLVQKGQAEHRHDRIADVFLDGAAVPLECRSHLVEVARHHLSDCLRVELLSHRGRPLEVREDDRHRLSHLTNRLRGDELCTAESAQPEALRVLLSAGRALDHDSVYDGSAATHTHESAPRRPRLRVSSPVCGRWEARSTPAAARSRPREGTRRAWRTIRGVRSPRRALPPRQRASDRDAGVRGPAPGAAETPLAWCGPPASADGGTARARERLPPSLRRSRRRGEPGRESFGRILPRTSRRLARSGPSRSPPGGTRAPAARAAPPAYPARPSHAGGTRATALRSTSLAHRRPGARRTTISGTRARGRFG